MARMSSSTGRSNPAFAQHAARGTGPYTPAAIECEGKLGFLRLGEWVYSPLKLNTRIGRSWPFSTRPSAIS